MSSTYIHPSSAQIQAISEMELDGPIIMLNMLRFAPDGGAEEYARYGAAALPFLAKVGASLDYAGDARGTFIGPDDESWDEILLVRYPNKEAFFAMTGDPDYPSQIRAGALADSRLYCTQERTSFADS